MVTINWSLNENAVYDGGCLPWATQFQPVTFKNLACVQCIPLTWTCAHCVLRFCFHSLPTHHSIHTSCIVFIRSCSQPFRLPFTDYQSHSHDLDHVSCHMY